MPSPVRAPRNTRSSLLQTRSGRRYGPKSPQRARNQTRPKQSRSPVRKVKAHTTVHGKVHAKPQAKHVTAQSFMWPPTSTPARAVKLPRPLAGITPLNPHGMSVVSAPPSACARVSATLARTLDDNAILFFTVTLRDGRQQLYATRVSKDTVASKKKGGAPSVTLRMGVPTTPLHKTQHMRQASPYPKGRAAECVELSLGPAGCSLEYLQTHAKYFLPGYFDDPLAGIPLKRCTQPRMEEGAAPWGRVWLEVTRQLCVRLGIRYLNLEEESSIATPGGQLVSLARVKLLTEGATWYERVLHAVPESQREAATYARSKARLAQLRYGNVTRASMRAALAALARLDGTQRQVHDTDKITGKDGVAARVIAAANINHAGTMRVLSMPPFKLDDPARCEHGNGRTAVSTFLGLLLRDLGVADPYALLWRADLAATQPIVPGVTLHGYVPASAVDVAGLLAL